MSRSRIHTGRRHRGLPLAGLIALAPALASADYLQDLLHAADARECIEDVAYRMIDQGDIAQASEVVAAALHALTLRGAQQRAIGCDGDIAAQAIAAGADPGEVLRATAAGL